MAGIKIVDLPPLGRDLASTDLLELSLAGGTGSRKITGQEIMNTSKLNIGTTAITSGTVGRVLFEGTGNVVQESANLFWDNTNGRLGIGTSTPAFPLDILGSSSIIGMKLRNSLSSGYTEINLFNNSGGNNDRMYMGVGGTTTGDAFQNRGYFFSGSNLEGINFTANKATTGDIRFFTGGVNERLRINGTGNVLINTTTDAGFRLDVNGTARVSSTLVLGGEFFGPNNTYLNGPSIHTGTLWLRYSAVNSYGNFTVSSGTVQAANILASSGNAEIKALGSSIPNFIIQNSTTSATWRIEGHRTTSGALEFKNDITNPVLNLFSTRNVGIGTFTDAGFKLDVNGTARFKDSGSNSSVIIDYATGGYIRVNDASLGEAIRLRAGGGASWFNTGQNLLIGTTTDAGFRLDVNGTARVSGPSTYSMVYDSNGILNLNGTYARLDLFNQSGSLRARLNCDGPNGTLTLYQNAAGYIFLNGAQSGNNSYISTALSIGNQSAANASSILEVSSTTKGFLPPRMTQTQRNAIASPAIGLEIYQTDATEGKYIYKSSGWTYIG